MDEFVDFLQNEDVDEADMFAFLEDNPIALEELFFSGHESLLIYVKDCIGSSKKKRKIPSVNQRSENRKGK